jgi:hypothetical protein
MKERPWIPFDGQTQPDNVHLMAIYLKLKSGEIRFADVNAAIMWENFGGPSDIVEWQPAYSLPA